MGNRESLFGIAGAHPNIEIVKKHYVALDVDGKQVQRTADVAFLEAVQAPANNRRVATASGKQLWSGGQRDAPDLAKVFEEFKQLPPRERQPKIEKVPKSETGLGRPTAPPGCLILRAYWQYLTRDKRGEIAPLREWKSCGQAYEDTPFAATDTLWIFEKEWKALVPEDPKKGAVVEIPPGLRYRIAWCYSGPHVGGVPGIIPYVHLTDTTAAQNSLHEMRSTEFTLKVDEVTPSGFVLRLDGLVKYGSGYNASDSVVHGTDVRYLGFLNYDARKKAFDRFDMVGLGTAWGEYWRAPQYDPESEVRQREHGIAFELVPGDRPADRVTPNWLKFGQMLYEEGK